MVAGPKPLPRPTVVLADDHAVLRAGIASLLAAEDDYDVVGEVADGAALVDAVREHPPDLAVIDLHMPDGGIEVISRLLEASPETRVVVLTMDHEVVFATRALRAGAVGYVLKEAAPFVLLEAMRTALAGGVYLQPELVARIARHPGDPLELLTDREIQVLEGIARGETSRQTGERLFLSARTVETYRARLQGKLGVSGVVQLTDLARRYGLVDADTG